MVEFYDGENFLAGLDDDDDDDIYNDEVYVCLSVCLSRFCLPPKFSLPTIHLGPAGRRPAWA